MRGLFCVEGAWSDDLTDPAGVGPSLRLLAENLPTDRRERMPLAHRVVDELDAALRLLDRWASKRYARLSVGLLTMHGLPGQVTTGGRATLTLEAIGERLSKGVSGRWLHISGCSVLRVPDHRIQAFLKETGLAGVSGYRRDVEWFDGMVFDLLLLGQLLTYDRWGAAVERAKKLAPGLSDELGFQAHRRG